MVGAAMAERELVRRVAGREAQELVAEADPENGDAAEELAHNLGLGDEGLGVAGAIREDDAVEAGEFVRRGRVRADGHRGAGLRETAHDRALRAVVDDSDARRAFLGEHVRLRSGDLRDERLSFHRGLRPHLLERVGHGERAFV